MLIGIIYSSHNHTIKYTIQLYIALSYTANQYIQTRLPAPLIAQKEEMRQWTTEAFVRQGPMRKLANFTQNSNGMRIAYPFTISLSTAG